MLSCQPLCSATAPMLVIRSMADRQQSNGCWEGLPLLYQHLIQAVASSIGVLLEGGLWQLHRETETHNSYSWFR